jgi:ATP-dependent protease Clp ATPase subunit
VSDETTEERRPTEQDILRERYHRQVDAIVRADWTPTEIAKRLRREVVGQDDAVVTLAGVLHRHLLTLRLDYHRSGLAPPPCKQPCLLVGDPGVGKTKLATELANLTQLGSVIADTSQLTEQGFIGNHAQDYCLELLEKSNFSLWLAEHGLIYCDEVDKCRIQPTTTRDVSGSGSQDSLLTLTAATGEVYCQGVTNGPNASRRYQGPFDVSRLMVIAGGAFSDGLHEVVAKRLRGKRGLGFGCAVVERTPDDAQRRADLLEAVTADDLQAYGLKAELVSRLATICVLRPLTREQMLSILAVVPSGPVRTTRRLCTLMGFDLRFTRPLLSTIVEEAMGAGLGARALAGITHRVCRRAMHEVPERVLGTRTQTAVVTLGVDAIRDGSYKLEWRAATPARGSVRRLVMDDAGGEGDGTQSGAG